MKTVLRARYEGVFAVLDAVRGGARFPSSFDEHVPATSFTFPDLPGRHEFKGQAFIPHMVYLDADERRIVPSREGPMSKEYFADQVRRALTQDNMTVIDHADVISGKRIPNDLESIAKRIIESKMNIHRQIEKLPEKAPESILMDTIVRSYLPPVSKPPGGVGTKATLTSALAIGMWKFHAYFDFYKHELRMAGEQDPRFPEFYRQMRDSQEPVKSDNGSLLANPHIVVAHASPYLPDAVSGLTRILGFRGTRTRRNRFGEFETVSAERATQNVTRTLGIRTIPEEAIWSYYIPRSGGRRVPIIMVHRHYAHTEPGYRPTKDRHQLLKPASFGFDPQKVRDETVERLELNYKAPVPGDV